jgi:hypothetical protein
VLACPGFRGFAELAGRLLPRPRGYLEGSSEARGHELSEETTTVGRWVLGARAWVAVVAGRALAASSRALSQPYDMGMRRTTEIEIDGAIPVPEAGQGAEAWPVRLLAG